MAEIQPSRRAQKSSGIPVGCPAGLDFSLDSEKLPVLAGIAVRQVAPCLSTEQSYVSIWNRRRICQVLQHRIAATERRFGRRLPVSERTQAGSQQSAQP